MKTQKKAIVFGLGLVLMVAGCQIDVTAGAGTKFFYPDSVGDKKIGDPRRPMYEGSGYVERHSAGGESDFKGFPKLGGGE